MKNLKLIFLILCFSTFKSYSQDFDFGKVSKEELQEKFHPKDSSANAAILYMNEEVKFNFGGSEGVRQERNIHQRIKIYNKEGFDRATQKIYLYAGNQVNKEKISNLKAYTYNLVDGKIIKEKLSSDGKFNEDKNEYLRVSSFTMPNIKEGSVIEFKYTIGSNRISIDDFDMQDDIPINNLDVRIETPEYFIYNKFLNPKASYVPQLKKEKKFRRSPFDYEVEIISINEKNIPSLKSEAFAGNINNYKSKLSLELTATLNAQKIINKTYSTSWEDVCKTIYRSSDFGEQIKRSNFYKNDLQEVISNITDDFEKALVVENFVKSKVKWNGRYGKYTQKGIRAAYIDGEGNDADINLLVVSMLRSLGVNANPVLISTRNNGIPLFPTLDGFNYVICSVQSGGKAILIDATSQYSHVNIIPFHALNWQGRLLIDDEVSQWINIMPNRNSIESTMLNVKINEDLSVTGKVSKNITSYGAYSYRIRYSDLSLDDHIKKLEEDKGDLEISSLEYENKKDVSKPVKLTYEYEFSDGIDEVGDKLYFSPLFFLKTDDNPFKLNERNYPIDFVVPFSDKYFVNIQLPEGYKIETLPEPTVIQFNDSEAKFSYMINANGQFLQLKVQLDINNPLVLPNDYAVFKDFYNRMVEKHGEQIVLTKV